MRWASGRARPKTRPSVRACSRIYRVAGCADRSLLVLLDGSQALRKAVRETFGAVALVQRCQIHKLRNILDHLPERQRPWVKAIVQRANRSADVATATRLLQDLARRLDTGHPSAASVREGLAETPTIVALGLSEAERRPSARPTRWRA